MLKVFECELLGPQDFGFILDKPTNRHIIVTVAFLEKFEWLSMREHFSNKTSLIHKCRTKLVKYCGMRFFQTMSDQEWEKKSKNVLILNEEISTEAELKEFMLKEQAIDDLDEVQYAYYFFPEMEGGRSAIVLKVHHCFTDGLGLSTLFLALSGEYDAKALPSLRPLPCYKQFVMDMLSPFIFLKFMVGVAFMGTDKNFIKNDLEPTGIKTGGYRYDFNITEMKKYCR